MAKQNTGDNLDALIAKSEAALHRIKQLETGQGLKANVSQRVHNHFAKHGSHIINLTLAGCVFVVAWGRLTLKNQHTVNFFYPLPLPPPPPTHARMFHHHLSRYPLLIFHIFILSHRCLVHNQMPRLNTLSEHTLPSANNALPVSQSQEIVPDL